jgi:SAM-dependent methyltransferase
MSSFEQALLQAGDPNLFPIDAFHARRSLVMRHGLDLARSTGAEIGALADPLINKSDGRVLYVDHTGTEELRAKYSIIAGFDVTRILPVDIALHGRKLSEALDGQKLDYIIAGHVLEHVPDLVGWFADMHDCLSPQGELRVVVPDCRFSFDLLREESRISDILNNWLIRAKRPGTREVIDFQLNYAPKSDGWGIYEGRAKASDASPKHDFATVIAHAEQIRDTDHYRDVHCWAFKPAGFARIMARLARYGLVNLACRHLSDAIWPMLEFYAILTPCDDPERTARSWEQAAAAIPEHVRGSGAAREAAERKARDEELIALRARLAAIEASRTWRMLSRLRRILPLRSA